MKDKQAKKGWDQYLHIYLAKGLIGYPQHVLTGFHSVLPLVYM